MKHYKTDSRKISFGEYWRISTGFGFVIGWINKIFGIPMNFISGIPEPQPFRDRLIETDRMPRTIFEKLNLGVQDLQQLGFNQFWFYTSKNSLTSGFGYAVQALHSSHEVVGKIIYVSVKTRESLVLAFLSELNDGILLATTNRKHDFNSPPKHVIQRKLGANASQLWELHQEQLAECGLKNPPEVFADFDQLAAFEDKNSRRLYEDKIKRGIWVEMTDSEVADLRSKQLPPPIPS